MVIISSNLRPGNTVSFSPFYFSANTISLDKSDRSVVGANATDYKVDELKINLDKARIGMNVLVLAGDGGEIGAGPSWKNRDNAINAGYTNKKKTYSMWVRYF